MKLFYLLSLVTGTSAEFMRVRKLQSAGHAAGRGECNCSDVCKPGFQDKCICWDSVVDPENHLDFACFCDEHIQDCQQAYNDLKKDPCSKRDGLCLAVVHPLGHHYDCVYGYDPEDPVCLDYVEFDL